MAKSIIMKKRKLLMTIINIALFLGILFIAIFDVFKFSGA